MRVRSMVLAACFLALLVTGCAKKKEDKPEGASQASGSTRPSTKKKEVVLAPVADSSYGYSISIPKGSQVLQKGEFGHTYSFPLPGGMHEYNVHITAMGSSSLKDLVRNATMMGAKTVAEQKTLADGGFLVVKQPQGQIQEVWVSKKGVKKSLTVKCTGRSQDKEKLVEICTSLKVTR